MEFKAKHKWIRLSPQKARLVADVVRGLDVQDAIDTLKFMSQKAAPLVSKAVRSALANAREYKGEDKPDVDKLFLKSVAVDVGPTLKRIKPRAYGRAHRIRRRTSHIMVVLAERPEEEWAAARARGEGRRKVGRREAPKGEPTKPAEGAPEERGAAPAKPKKARFLGFKKKQDKYGAKVKGAGEAREKPAAEHRKTKRGTKRGRKKK
jgi:large subunit ribosomal protein L22